MNESGVRNFAGNLSLQMYKVVEIMYMFKISFKQISGLVIIRSRELSRIQLICTNKELEFELELELL